jgi:hypothetical protein
MRRPVKTPRGDYNARIEAEFKPSGAIAVRTSKGLLWRFAPGTPKAAAVRWLKIESKRKDIDAEYNAEAPHELPINPDDIATPRKTASEKYRQAIYELYLSLQPSRVVT